MIIMYTNKIKTRVRMLKRFVTHPNHEFLLPSILLAYSFTLSLSLSTVSLAITSSPPVSLRSNPPSAVPPTSLPRPLNSNTCAPRNPPIFAIRSLKRSHPWSHRSSNSLRWIYSSVLFVPLRERRRSTIRTFWKEIARMSYATQTICSFFELSIWLRRCF